jgi:hypothetical protein
LPPQEARACRAGGAQPASTARPWRSSRRLVGEQRLFDRGQGVLEVKFGHGRPCLVPRSWRGSLRPRRGGEHRALRYSPVRWFPSFDHYDHGVSHGQPLAWCSVRQRLPCWRTSTPYPAGRSASGCQGTSDVPDSQIFRGSAGIWRSG